MLKNRGFVYEAGGAVWFKATEFGGEKDEVLIRDNGIPTYFLADIAYHYNKLVDRGFDKAIDIWGADHHGHVARLKWALEALGIDSERLDIILMQMVRLVRDGETVKLSKRSGKSITLTSLLDEIPIDAARFFFNMREASSHFDFDLDLAIEESSKNPVYYVQYAHARICQILKNIEELGYKPSIHSEYELLKTKEEIELIKDEARELLQAIKDYENSLESPIEMQKKIEQIKIRIKKSYSDKLNGNLPYGMDENDWNKLMADWGSELNQLEMKLEECNPKSKVLYNL